MQQRIVIMQKSLKNSRISGYFILFVHKNHFGTSIALIE